MLHRLIRLTIFAMVLTLQASSSNATTNNVNIVGKVLQNEGMANERNETDQSGNQVIDQTMSHKDLVIKLFEMENEMKSQNKLIQFQDKRIDNQEKKILLLETRSVCGTINEYKTSRNINTSLKIIPKRRVKRPASSGSSNKVIPKNKLYDPDYPDTVVSRVSSRPIGDSRIRVVSNSISTSSTGGVHFFVQRNRPCTTEGAIPFQIEKLNIGGAIKIFTGVFNASRNGVYHFAFSGMMKFGGGRLLVLLRRNMNETIAVANGDINSDTTYMSRMISFTATIQLKKNDKIDLFKTNGNGVLNDSHYYPYTRYTYTGSLLMVL